MTFPKDSQEWDELLAFDRSYVWHPYAALPPADARATMPALPVVSARGARVRLADGRELVDGMSSWWAAIWGYRHPVIDAAVFEQLQSMAHVMFGGLTHAPAVLLAKRLTTMAPPGLDKVFFADSGSVSVEVALKLAAQYQQAAGRPRRTRYLALLGGYHGDTLGAMSVCDPVNGMHHLFSGTLPQHFFAPRPPKGPGVSPQWLADVEALVESHSDELAAIIAEPIAQGAGGMWFYDAGYVASLRQLADEHGLLLILDEIATGFGRTGPLFASSAAEVVPDIMCIGKALSGGYMSLAAVLCTARVAGVVSNSPPGCLMHGPTFMANPLACAAALASTGLFASGQWRDSVAQIETQLRTSLEPAMEIPGVADVRVLGAIGVVQLDHPVDVAAATKAAIDHGAWLRPFRDLIYTMPPYICTTEEVATIAAATISAAEVG